MLPGCPLASHSYFHFAYEFHTRKLAYVLDSLVRVTRRVGKSRFGKINYFPQALAGFALLLFARRSSSCLSEKQVIANSAFGLLSASGSA